MPTSTVSPRRLAAAAVAGALALGVVATPAFATGGSTFVQLTNEKRASVGLGAVSFYAPVDTIAVERGDQLASADTMEHDLTYVTRRLGELGVCWTNVGEIIAWEKGYPEHSYQRTIDMWWASTSHHEIMVGSYNVAAGSWAVSRSGATYSVMIFVKTCASVQTGVPTVVSRSPGSGTTGVSLWAAVRVGFSEDVRGVSTSSFVLRDSATGSVIAASVTYDSVIHKAILRPASHLRLGAWYRASLSSSIHDRSGNPLAATSWTFRATTIQVYDPERELAFTAGTHTGYRFSSSGAILSSKAYTLSRASGADTSRRAVIGTRKGTWFYVTDGVWAGYWLLSSTSVYLA